MWRGAECTATATWRKRAAATWRKRAAATRRKRAAIAAGRWWREAWSSAALQQLQAGGGGGPAKGGAVRRGRRGGRIQVSAPDPGEGGGAGADRSVGRLDCGWKAVGGSPQ